MARICADATRLGGIARRIIQRQDFENAHAPLDPDVADLAPSDPALAVHDEEHALTYMRMLDADAEGALWREVARIVLHIDPDREPDRAAGLRVARAKWMTKDGYRHLLGRGWSRATHARRGEGRQGGVKLSQRARAAPI